MDHRTVETCTAVRQISFTDLFLEEAAAVRPRKSDEKDHPDCFKSPRAQNARLCDGAGLAEIIYTSGSVGVEKAH